MSRSISSKLFVIASAAVRLTCTDHRIIEILGLRPSNRLPVSYYKKNCYVEIEMFINQIRAPLFFLSQSLRFSDLQIAVIEKRTIIIFAQIYRFK